MILLYADANISSALVGGLKRRGVDIIMAREDLATRLPDRHVMDRAIELGRTLITHDRDFTRIARAMQASDVYFPGVVLITTPSHELQPALDDLEMFALVQEPDEVANRLFYLPYPR